MIMLQSLSGNWKMHRCDDDNKISCKIPGSLYSTFIENGLMDDPYYRLNEYISTDLCRHDYMFETSFVPEPEMMDCSKRYMRFKGIDTLSEIYLNGMLIGSTDNMHRTYEFDVTNLLATDENLLQVKIFSPINFIEKKQTERSLWGVSSTMSGYPHIRKAHYMYGWDWGPKLPDMGIWRDVCLVGVIGARIESVYVKQNHMASGVALKFDTSIKDIMSDRLHIDIHITAPDGSEFVLTSKDIKPHTFMSHVIINPFLWNVRGYGKQDLYMVEVMLFDDDMPVDRHVFNLGLRKIEISRDMDDAGEEFCFKVNDMKIFAMGANYIPEDHIISRCNSSRTKKLLQSCVSANFNMIRVWGGGYYPDDYFYDLCDKLGLLVWQDFMFACSVYDNTPEFYSTVKKEVANNVKRLRNHASLGMWCGNNEIESAWQYWGLPEDEELKEGYTNMFEVIIPSVVRHYDPQTFYWPSSPSSGGGFNDSSAENKGDTHYWAVWHSLKPFTDFKNYKFRFCSEYGFESLPCMKTIESFAENSDYNLMSPVMEAHQKCELGNEKIMYYLAQMVHYPYSFENLIYATQLVQAEAIKVSVEHMRRNRGVCMGSLYWQVNDSNPVISWSSIDYHQRWKALHYYAKKFYSPVLCSIDDADKEKLVFNISNEKTVNFVGKLKWRVRKNDTTIVASGEEAVEVKALSALDCLHLTSRKTSLTPDMHKNHYIEYKLVQNNTLVSSGTYMFVLPKQFEYLNPDISCKVIQIGDIYKFSFNSQNFAKSVYIDFDDFDCIFNDNWFDIHGTEISVIVPRMSLPLNSSADSLMEKIKIKSYYDLYNA